nr:carboxypeptidase regulatory-like domain-containing protein [Salinibacter ruber]
MSVEATASGTVTDSDTGDPIEGASVTGTRPDGGEQLFEATTSSDGTYDVTFKVADEPSEVEISASADGFEMASQTVTFSEDISVSFELPSATTQSTASGQVTREDNGDPIGGTSVTGTRAGSGEKLFETTTASDGTYEATFGVTDEPSEVTIQADAENFESGEQTVNFGEQITADVSLQPATIEATASGTVSRSDSGDPIEGATVTGTRSGSGEQLFEATTSSDGSYEASYSVKATNEPSEVTLSASATDFKSGESTVAFAPSITLDFLLEATATGVQTTPVIANSGNFSAQDGSLTLYNPTDSTATLKDINVAFINSLAQHNGRLFVVDNTASDNAGRVTTFDTDRLEPIDQISNPRPPRYVAFPGDDKGYITNQRFDENFEPQPSTVSVVDLVDNSVTKQVDVGRSPQGMGVAGGKVFVANAADGTLSVLDADADTVNTTLSLPDCASPKSVFVDDENEVAVVCQGGGEQASEVLFLSPIEETIKDRVELGAPIGSANGSQSAYYSEGAEELYAISGVETFGGPPLGGTGEIFRVDTDTNVLDATLEVPQDDELVNLTAVGYDAVTQDLYVTRLPVGDAGGPLFSADGTALILDRSGDEVTRFETGNAPGHITFLNDRQ